MGLTASVINKLILARHLFTMSLDNLRSHRDIALYATVNLMQDAVEAFLLAVSEHLNAGIDSTTTFERYFTKIEAQIAPNNLPFRSKLIALNKVRVAAKHHGVKPDRKEVEGFAVVCREFFDESCNSIVRIPFWSISLLDLLDDGEAKQLLTAARVAFDSGNYLACLIECRKVLFIKFEKSYDIARFREDGELAGILAALTSAPAYAARHSYIEESVRTPFDLIVLDHRRLDSDLMADGIDTQVFWNIWRLTPSVYRFSEYDKPVGDWLVKREFKKEENATEEHASYVLENTIDIALHIHQRRRLLRYSREGNYFIRLERDGVNLYEKADRNSAVSMVTKPGLRKISVDYSTVGLNGDGMFWHVSHYEGGGVLTPGVTIYHGYIHDDDVDFSDREESDKSPEN